LKPEVVVPSVTSRIEEPCNLSCAPINCSNVTPFVPIAHHTDIRQITGGRSSTVLATDNVINLMREASFQFMNEAILPALTRTLGYFRS
jgi:hypothetical protein